MNIPHCKTFLTAILLTLGLTQPAFPHGDETHGEIGRAELNALYTAYLDIHKALAVDDLEAAQAASRDFLRAPHKFPVELSHNVKAADLIADLRALNAAKDIKTYRRAFQTFSNRMIVLLSEAENAGEMPVLVYHCPMAGGNKGADWLQAKDGAENPYFGASMPKCGSLKKTLHAGSGDTSKTRESGENHEEHH